MPIHNRSTVSGSLKGYPWTYKKPLHVTQLQKTLIYKKQTVYLRFVVDKVLINFYEASKTLPLSGFLISMFSCLQFVYYDFFLCRNTLWNIVFTLKSTKEVIYCGLLALGSLTFRKVILVVIFKRISRVSNFCILWVRVDVILLWLSG